MREILRKARKPIERFCWIGFLAMFVIAAGVTYEGKHMLVALMFLAVAKMSKLTGPAEKPAEPKKPKKRNGNGC